MALDRQNTKFIQRQEISQNYINNNSDIDFCSLTLSV